jgi:hypothetical protein
MSPKTHFPITLDFGRKTVAFHELRRLRSFAPPASPFTISADLSATIGRYSPGVRPLQSTTDHTSGPQPAQTLRSENDSPTRSWVNRDPRDLATPGLGWDLNARRNERLDPLGSFQSPSRLARTTSRWRPCFLGLRAWSRNSSPPTYEASKYVDS